MKKSAKRKPVSVEFENGCHGRHPPRNATQHRHRRVDFSAQDSPVEPMKKEQIVEALETIATLLELQDENPFKIRAYSNAARSIETWGGNLCELAEENRLEEIPGIGKAIASKITELVLTGSSKFYDELRAKFPPGILELFSLPGLGAKKIKALHEKLQVGSIADLQQACQAGRVAELPGFGKTTQEKIALTIANRAQHAGSFQLGAVAAEAEQLQDDLRAHPNASRVSIAGSYRRRKEIVRDLDFIVATKRIRRRSRKSSPVIRSWKMSSRVAQPRRVCVCARASRLICAL